MKEKLDNSSLPRSLSIILFLSLSLFFLYIYINNAWLADDAFITFRCIRNFVSGGELSFNPGERIQAYTHPLWFFTLLPVFFVFKEIALPIYILSFLISFLAFGLGLCFLLKRAKNTSEALIGALSYSLVLFSSKAFIDYTSSGLENPLSYLLAGAFFLLFFSCQKTQDLPVVSLGAVMSLALLNRLDTILLFFPAFLFILFSLFKTQREKIFPYLSAFLLPLIFWHLFTLIYYGFPFPNTFYAKIVQGIPRGELLQFGFHYLKNSFTYDPITLTIILLSTFGALFSRTARGFTTSLGILSYIGYVVWIGGDFMSGRFLALPFFISVLLYFYTSPSKMSYLFLGAVSFILAIFSPYSPIYSGAEYQHFPYDRGIVDERGGYYPYTGLLKMDGGLQITEHEWYRDGEKFRDSPKNVSLFHAIGFYGWAAGSEKKVYDVLALTSPYLARLPITQQEFRPGHLHREGTKYFLLSKESNTNFIKGEKRRKLYEQIELITSGPIFSKERLKAILKINLEDFTS